MQIYNIMRYKGIQSSPICPPDIFPLQRGGKNLLRYFGAISFFVLVTINISAQKTSVADSLWCSNLDNIIRCASLDQIVDPVGNDIADSEYIAPLTPLVRLSKSPTEKISKEYNKVNYTCYLYSATKSDKTLEAQYDKWYKKVKSCLTLWEDAKLANSDKSITDYQDHFFTNSEDETTVRMDIVHRDGYHVRIRIY
jgi:hypothetical protein